jgi:hypothetical protein
MRPPISLIFISVLSILSGFAVLVFIPYYLSEPFFSHRDEITYGPAWLIITFIVVSGGSAFISGVAMLMRKKWGRQLLLISYPVVMVLNGFLSTTYLYLLFAVPIYLSYLFFLTRPIVNDYFYVTVREYSFRYPFLYKTREPVTTRKLILKFAAVVLFCIGGYLLLMTSLGFIIGIHIAERVGLYAIGLLLTVTAAVCIAAGVFMWNPERWRILIGIIGIISGMCLMFFAVAIILFLGGGLADIEQPEMRFILNKESLLLSAVTGIVYLTIGFLLIRWQLERDRDPSS